MIEWIENEKYHGGEKFVTIFSDELESPLVATSSHPSYEEVRAILLSYGRDDERVSRIQELLDMETVVAQKFDAITERVSVANGVVYFDGDPIDNSVTNQIIRFLREGIDVKPLCLFMEKLYQNPNAHSREQLYSWLKAKDFTINSQGDIYAYKGVKSDYGSINRGPAIVNGEAKNGSIPNEIGNVIEMPRSKVAFDPSIGCSTGLHVGTYDYASSFSQGKVLGVLVNPRDIVSVPTDSSAQKVRTCRYTVVEEVESFVPSAYYDDSYKYEDAIDYDEYESDEYEDTADYNEEWDASW